MNSPEIDKKIHKSEETEALVLKLSLGSEPSAQSLIAFDHVILEFWKTDKVFHFCCRLGVYAYVYAHTKRHHVSSECLISLDAMGEIARCGSNSPTK